MTIDPNAFYRDGIAVRSYDLDRQAAHRIRNVGDEEPVAVPLAPASAGVGAARRVGRSRIVIDCDLKRREKVLRPMLPILGDLVRDRGQPEDEPLRQSSTLIRATSMPSCVKSVVTGLTTRGSLGTSPVSTSECDEVGPPTDLVYEPPASWRSFAAFALCV